MPLPNVTVPVTCPEMLAVKTSLMLSEPEPNLKFST